MLIIYLHRIFCFHELKDLVKNKRTYGLENLDSTINSNGYNNTIRRISKTLNNKEECMELKDIVLPGNLQTIGCNENYNRYFNELSFKNKKYFRVKECDRINANQSYSIESIELRVDIATVCGANNSEINRN